MNATTPIDDELTTQLKTALAKLEAIRARHESEPVVEPASFKSLYDQGYEAGFAECEARYQRACIISAILPLGLAAFLWWLPS